MSAVSRIAARRAISLLRFTGPAVAACGVAVLIAFAAEAPDGATPSTNAVGDAATRSDDGSDEALASHRRMVDALRAIADDTPDEHPVLGTRKARELRAALSAMGDGGDPRARIRLEHDLGHAELFLGDAERAIELFLAAKRRLPESLTDSAIAAELLFSLGVAHMRLGEDRNCCARHTGESCILPFRGGGIHTDQHGSRQAMIYFLQVLENPSSGITQGMSAMWLLNLAAMTLDRYPGDVPEQYRIDPAAFGSTVEFPRFANIAPRVGLATSTLAGGAIVDDFDDDDLLDVITSSWDTVEPLRYFRNDGDGSFTERTKAAGLSGIFGGLNTLQADYDNDGDLDILVLRGAWLAAAGRHPNSLLRNDGGGTFVDVTFLAGLGEAHYPTKTAAWADYDNDGDVDLFVGNESSDEIDAPSQLFRNDGDGTFTDVAAEAGILERHFVMASVWGDYDGDRWPDLYVAGGWPNRLYRNDGDGTFTEVAKQAGVTGPRNSFPSWFWDFDNDGILDLFVSSSAGGVEWLALFPRGIGVYAENPAMRAMQEKAMAEVQPHHLYRGNGKGGFDEVARERGLVFLDLPMGANFGDLNNDGFADFYLGTGDILYSELRPNVMYLNRGGREFVNVTIAGGFGHLQKGHGVSFADLDNDSDLDVFIQMGGGVPGDKFSDALFHNPGFGNHSLTVKLVGTKSNRSAIGARIRADVTDRGKKRSVYRHVTSGGSFGANPLRQTLGVGAARRVDVLEVFWPTTGRRQVFRDVPVDRTIVVVEGEEDYRTLELPRIEL